MSNNYKDLADCLNFDKERIPRARRFRAHFTKIEVALETGITIKSLVAYLNENGFSITFKTFEGELYRARKFLKEKSKNKPIAENKINPIITKQQTILPHGKIINDNMEETLDDFEEAAINYVANKPKSIF
jgi:hypothetical protein